MKKILALAAAALVCGSALADGEVDMKPTKAVIEASPNSEVNLQFDLTNSVQCLAFDWTLELPKGVGVVVLDEYEENGETVYEYDVDFGNRLSANYTVDCNYKKGSTSLFSIVVTNPAGKKLMAKSEGLFCTVALKVGDVEPGEYTIRVIEPNFWWNESGEVLSCYPTCGDITLKVENSGINGVMADDEAPVYTLQGVRVEGQPEPGIYIRGGKKIIIK